MVYLINLPVTHSVTLLPKKLNFIFWYSLYYKSHANRHNSHYTYFNTTIILNCISEMNVSPLSWYQTNLKTWTFHPNGMKTLRTFPHIYIYALVSILTIMLRISDTLNWFLTFFNSSNSFSHSLTAVKMIQTRICSDFHPLINYFRRIFHTNVDVHKFLSYCNCNCNSISR